MAKVKSKKDDIITDGVDWEKADKLMAGGVDSEEAIEQAKIVVGE